MASGVSTSGPRITVGPCTATSTSTGAGLNPMLIVTDGREILIGSAEGVITWVVNTTSTSFATIRSSTGSRRNVRSTLTRLSSSLTSTLIEPGVIVMGGIGRMTLTGVSSSLTSTFTGSGVRVIFPERVTLGSVTPTLIAAGVITRGLNRISTSLAFSCSSTGSGIITISGAKSTASTSLASSLSCTASTGGAPTCASEVSRKSCVMRSSPVPLPLENVRRT